MPSKKSLLHDFARGAFAAALLVALAPGSARAQQQPQPQPAQPAQPAQTAQPTGAATPVDPARLAFEAGVAAMQRQDWPAALASFEESDRLRRSASVSLNLGVVLHQLRRLVEARVRLQSFMELATPAQHAQHDPEVQRLLTDIARRLARVRVTELTPPVAVVSVDGRRAQLNDAGETVLDPGAHTVRAEAAGYLPFEERVEIPESALREVRVVLQPAPAAVSVTQQPQTPHPAQPARPPESHPFYTRWWFWTAVGVVVAGGVTTGVVLATRGPRDLPPADVFVDAIRVGGAP